MPHHQPARIKVFIDGSYLYSVHDYYQNVSAEPWGINFRNFLYFLRMRISEHLLVSPETTSITECHLFMDVAKEDRERFQHELSKHFIHLHFCPAVQNQINIDAYMRLAMTALESAYKGEYEVAVIIAGNKILMPLICALKRANKDVILPYWQGLLIGGDKNQRIETNRSLINTASLPIDIGSLLHNPKEDWDMVKKIVNKGGRLPEYTRKKEQPKKDVERLRGTIVKMHGAIGHIEPKTGLGRKMVSFRNWNVTWDSTDFKSLKEGMEVEYEMMSGARRAAINVTPVNVPEPA